MSDTDRDAPDRLPAKFAAVVQRWRRLQPEIDASSDLLTGINRRLQDLEALLAELDAIHVLGLFTLSEVVIRDPDAYIESESAGSPHIVELLAGVLLRRASRAGELPVTPFIDARTLGPARELLHEIGLLEGLRRHRTAMLGGDALAEAQGRAALKYLLRDAPGWPDQEHEVLLELFGQEQFAGRLRATLGFDVESALACVEALPDLLHDQVDAHMREAHGESRAKALDWAAQVIGIRDGASVDEDVRDRAFGALWAMNHYSDSWCFTPDALARAAHLAPPVARAFVRALATPFGQEGDVFEIVERVHDRPFIDCGDGSYFPITPGNDLWALRGAFERALRARHSYSKHRGRWLELKAGRALAAALNPDETHFAVGLFSMDGDQLGEIDCLLRLGDTVITVEAKSAAQRAGAKRGGRALVDHLEQNVKKAAEQASLAQRALSGEADVELRSTNGRTLRLESDVREVHAIVVTLDDLSTVAPVIWQLAGSRVLPSEVTIPWLVNWYELDLVCRLVQWPAQLVHFLRRRSRMNEIGHMHAADELDWWMLYLDGGLFFEDDEAIRKGADVRYLSQTDALDAWVMWERGDRVTPAPKPRQRLEPETERILDFLDEHRPPGAIPAACALLDISSEAREQVHRHVGEARQRARARNRVQRGTHGFTDAPRPFFVSWLVVPDEARSVLQDVLRDHVEERLDEFGVMAVVAFGFCASSARPFDALLVLAARWRGLAVPFGS